MGETFYSDLAKFSKQYPSPELRAAINNLALTKAQFVDIKTGLFKGQHEINPEWSPVLSADLFTRVGRATGGHGLPPDKVDLVPRPTIEALITELPPHIRALMVPIR